MAIGREAARDQLAAVLLTATTAPHALPANLARWNRHTTPTEDLSIVFFTLTWDDDVGFDRQSKSGNKRIDEFGLALTLLTFMQEDAVQNGSGTPGALGDETAEDRLMTYWETLKERLNAEAHWDQSNTGIFDVRDLRKVGDGPNSERLLVKRFRMSVRIDKPVS